MTSPYEKQAQEIGRAWPPRGDSEICRKLATLTEAPEAWLDALLAQGTSGVLTGPFLERIVETRREGEKLMTSGKRSRSWDRAAQGAQLRPCMLCAPMG